MKVEDVIKKAKAKECMQLLGFHKVRGGWSDGQTTFTKKEFEVLCKQVDNTAKKANKPAIIVLGIIIGM